MAARFRVLRRLVAAREGVIDADGFRISGRVAVRCTKTMLAELESEGLLRRIGDRVVPLPEARTWLKRHLAEADAFAAQHRVVVTDKDDVTRNLMESPLRPLCAGSPAFLAPHQQVAAERIMRWAERARMMPRITTSYGTGHIASTSRRQPDPTAISDMAVQARKHLSAIYALLPHDCAEIVTDICVFELGLQQAEQARGWPRRSAKLVLLIALDQLARSYGLAPQAEGAIKGRQRIWLGDGARPTVAG